MLAVRSARGANPLCLLVATLVVVGLSLASMAASGATYTWQPISGDWSTISNWGSALPAAADTALIDNGGTATVTSVGPLCGTLTLGDSRGVGSLDMTGGSLYAVSAVNCGQSGTGSIVQSGGTTTLGNTGVVAVGLNAGSNGSYGLSGFAALSALAEFVGDSGSGVFVQSGGTNAIGGNLDLGANVGGNGSYFLSGTGGLVAQYEYLGLSGSGAFSHSGGTNTVSHFYLGEIASGSGSYTLSGAGVLSGTSEIIGDYGIGSFVHTSGTNNASGSLYLGNNSAAASGSYSLGGCGVLNSPNEYIGCRGSGAFSQSGGTNAIGTGLNLGLYTGSSGSYLLSGSGMLTAAVENIGSSNSGVGSFFAQTGGTNAVSSNLNIGYRSGGSGSYTLSGNGWLTTNYLYVESGMFSQSGGVTSASKLYVDFGSGDSGAYNFSGGSLAAATGNIGYSGSGVVNQSGGSASITNLSLGCQSWSSGSYSLSGNGILWTQYEEVGSSGMGTFVQSGGANTMQELDVASNGGGSGTYDLSGGSLAAQTEWIGILGAGAFNQSGGSHAVSGALYLGDSPSSTATYLLSGSGLLSCAGEYVGYSNSAVSLFQQSGGSNSTGRLAIGGKGRYVLGGGTLQLAAGGLYSNAGTLDGGNGPGVLGIVGSSIVDLSQGSVVNTASLTVAVGPWSLFIVPPSIDPFTSFASYSNAGLLYTRGSPLTVPAGRGFSGTISISDPVACQGSIIAAQGAINLTGGLQLSGTGVVNLGSGTLTTDNSASSVLSGSLSTTYQVVGYSSTGSFVQTGGTNAAYALYLGYNPGSSGSYALSGGGLLQTTSVEYIGYSGSGSFSQSGGTNAGGALYLGYNSGSSGNYALGGNCALNRAEYVGYSPSATALFQQTGGTNSPALLSIGPGGRYLLAGGLLQFGSANALVSAGTLDGGNAPGTLRFGGSMVADLSQGTLINMSSTTLSVGPGSLLIVPAGFNPATALASYSNSGSLHVRGTTFSIAPTQSYNLTGTIPDPVVCQGFLTSNGPLVLNGGLTLSGTGVVNPSMGTLTTDNATSVMSGGTLTAGTQYVGLAGAGTFTQSGGFNRLNYSPGQLSLGVNLGSSGTYNLYDGLVSGATLCIANSGIGTFNQSGGTCAPSAVVLGNAPGSLGTYQLSGSGLLNDTSTYVGYQGAGEFIQSGGSQTAPTLDLASQSKNATGYYNLSGGSLTAWYETIGDVGSATFVQSGGTHIVTSMLYLGKNSGAAGSYLMSGGSLSAASQYIGYGGTGVLTQTAGTDSTSGLFSSNGSCSLSGGLLTAGSENIGGVFNQSGGANAAATQLTVGPMFGSGTYSLSGNGLLAAGSENIGYSGTGVFNHSGGTNAVGTQLLLGGPSTSGTYNLGGNGVLSAASEYLGLGISGSGVFNQSSGSNSTSYLAIGPKGKYTFNGGTLQLAAGAAFSNSGIFSGAAGVLNFAGSSIFDITQGAVQNTGSMIVSLGPGSLLIAPSSFNSSTTFGQYSNAGLLYTRGTPLTVSGTQAFYGTGSIGDQVICQGNVAALAGPINLSAGLQLFGSGSVNLGSGSLTIQDATSRISGGSLSAGYQVVAPTGTGVFTQSGGISTIANLAIDNGGSYVLSGGTLDLAPGGTFFSGGTLDGGNAAGVLTVVGSMVVDLSSGSVVRTSATQLHVGPASLLIVPASMNPSTAFDNYSNAGVLYTRGSPLTIAAGQSVFGICTITDPLACLGSLITAGGGSTLTGVLTMSGTGVVNLGPSGVFTIDSGTSMISGGSLAAQYEYLGNAGTAALVQSGGTNSISGSLYLGYHQTGSGAYFLNGGLLRLAGLSLGSGSGSFSFGGGTLQAATSFTTSLPIALSAGDSTIDTGGKNTTFSGLFSGSGSLVKSGSGTLVLSNAANSYSGATQLSAGTLNFANNASLGSGSILFSGGVLQWGSSNRTDVSARIAPIPAGIAAGIDTNGNNVTFASSLSGDGGLTKLGSGALTLANSNTLAGTVTLSAGSLTLANSAALLNGALVDNVVGGLGFGPGVTAVQAGSLAGNGGFSLTNSGSPVLLTVGGNNATTTYTGSITGGGGLTKTGSGKLTIGAGNFYSSSLPGSLHYSGMTNVNGGTLELVGGQSYNIQGTLATGATVNVGSGATLQLSRGDALGYYSGAVAAVNINGGTMISSATMAGYNWTTLPPINLSGGTIAVANDYYVPPGVTGYGVEQYILDGDVTTFAGSAASQITASEIYLRGNPAFSQTAVFNVAKGTAPVDLVIAAHLVVDPNYVTAYPGLIKNGAGSLELTNVVECPVIVNAGTLISAGSGMASSDVTLAGSGTLIVAGTGPSGPYGDLQIHSLSGSGAVVLQRGGLLVGSATSSTTFSGTISGAGGLSLTAGLLVLSGSSNYLGGTTVSGGTLDIGNPWSLPDGGSLTVGATQSFAAPAMESAAVGVAVPEPSATALLAAFACGAAVWRRITSPRRPSGGRVPSQSLCRPCRRSS